MAHVTKPPAIALMREQCMRYSNSGFCTTRRCLVRGGAMGETIAAVPYERAIEMATCEYHEAVKAFDALEAIAMIRAVGECPHAAEMRKIALAVLATPEQ